jgi:hypothetical protein
MIHDGPEQAIDNNGFVDIATAERMRQQETVATFRARHEPEFQRLLKAAVGLKLAHRELDDAKHAAASQPSGLPIGDLLDGIEREARKQIQQLDDGLTIAQLAQVKAEVGGAPDVSKITITQRKKAS